MSWKTAYYEFMKRPYYEMELYSKKENKRIGVEYFKMNGQSTFNSKQFPCSYIIPPGMIPDSIGYRKRLKYYVDNAFPRCDPRQYRPSEDYEVLNAAVVQNEDGTEKETVLTIDSRFFKKLNETRFAGEIIAEPPDKWAWLQPIILAGVVLFGLYILLSQVMK